MQPPWLPPLSEDIHIIFGEFNFNIPTFVFIAFLISIFTNRFATPSIYTGVFMSKIKTKQELQILLAKLGVRKMRKDGVRPAAEKRN